MRTDLRCQGDVELEKKLLAEPEIRRAIEASEKKPDLGARKALLATAVRVAPELSPRLDTIVHHCIDKLGVTTPIETYVYASASFNAGMLRPEKGRSFLLLTSSLLETFDDEELHFAIGHELGHHVFEHHKIPLVLDEAQTAGPLAMTMFAWSRYAEISADRAGLVCAGKLDPAARTLFKLASGLHTDVVKMSADALLSQALDIREEIRRANTANATPSNEWFATHPFSPLRLRAAKAFSDSTQFGGTRAMNDVEAEVAELMSLMEPTYLQEKSEPAELMRRLLLAGAVAVANASGGISADEKKVIDRFFGAGSADSFNAKALTADLERRTNDVKARVPKTKQIQVLRDLCLVALADGNADDAERTVLYSVAKGLEVGVDVIERTLAQPPMLD
jgi:Zn-dependent protease with chaperone function/tellurite resistance protein